MPANRQALDAGTRWGIAAAVCLVLGPVAAIAAVQLTGWFDKSRATREKQAALAASQAELDRLKAQQQAARDQARKDLDPALAAEQQLAKDYQAAVQAARKAIEAKDFVVRLTGPARIQPGAPNTWQVETLDARGQAVRPKKMEVAVKDGDAALFRQEYEKVGGPVMLTLPPDFWAKVKPGTDLFLEVLALTDDDRRGLLTERLPLNRPVYVTHLATDKPLYKPGETIRFRSLTLDRATLTPPAHDLNLKFRLRDPAGTVVPLDEGNGRLVSGLQPVLGPDKKPVRGIGVGEYAIPAGAPGGEYRLELYEAVYDPARGGSDVLLETRKFIVNRYVPDVFEKKLEFDGKSYGPGDTVQARIEVSRTAGGPMKDARATVVAGVDGRTFHEEKGATFVVVPAETGGTKAVLNVRFKVPADIFEKAQGNTPPNAVLAVTIHDGTDSENILRPIPLVTKNLRVEFFPEGGDLVEGVAGRVYFQVRTPFGKPADLKGVITDGTEKVADAATETDAENEGVNRGHGVFTFTPKAGAKYFLKLTSPAGIVPPTPNGFPLPAAKADGVALRSLDTVTGKGAPIRVRVETVGGPKTLHVGAYARGRLVAHKTVEVGAGKWEELTLRGDESVGGVTRVTVFEEMKADGSGRANVIPRAERLVYRVPGQQLVLDATPDRERYTPAGKVKLELSARNEKNDLVPAVLLVGVVNRSVITMADNKTDRLMPTHFLLSGDVKNPAELEHADFLLTGHPKAGVALDLLLGTQGWRRFAEQTGNPLDVADRADVDRMLIAHGQKSSAPLELYRLEQQRVDAEFRPRMEQATLRRAAAAAALAEFEKANPSGIGGQVAAAQTATNAAQQQATDAAAELYRYETRATNPRSWGLPVLMLGLAALTVTGVSFGVRQPTGSRRPYFFGAGGTFVLFVLGAGAVYLTRGTDAAEVAWAQAERKREREQLAKAAGDRDDAPAGFAAQPMMPVMPRAAAKNAPPRDGANVEFDRFVERALVADAAPPAAGPRPKVDPTAAPKPTAKANWAWKLDAEKGKAAKDDRAGEQAKERALVADALRKQQQPQMGGRGRPGRPAEPMAPGTGIAAREAQFGEMRAEDWLQLAQLPPFVVREYAHQRDPALGEVRSDFTETVYWHPVFVLPDTGKATVEFQLSDDIARYQVVVAGHTTDGRIGAVVKTIEARKPFSLDPKLPLEISHTDTVDVPVRVTNDSDDRRSVAYTVTPTGLKLDGNSTGVFDLGPNGKDRKIVRLRADKLQGDAGLLVEGTSGADKDSIGRAIKVVPDGFPGVGSFADMIEGRASGRVVLPQGVVPGSLKVRLEVYPTSMADLVKGLDGLLREPYGCFEQTSTTNYPNTMILDYMSQTNQANPEAVKKARGFLDRGYARLVSFECRDNPKDTKHGFEWFGAADAQHEALTAYGLLQFKDMARVHPVDPELIKRTQAFLLSRRDGNGGFLRNKRALDGFGGAPKHTTDAYIVWALVESDPDDAEKLDLRKEIDALKAEAQNENSVGGKDAYFVALTANVLLLRGDRAAAHALLDRLKEKHLKNGAVTGAQTSITRSGGRTLEIETTALAVLGWLRANDPKYATAAKDATKWLSQQRGGYGGYGSTQSTILALKALTLHAKKSAHPPEAGEIRVSVGGKQIASRRFSEKDVEVIGLDIENPEAIFKGGEASEVEIAMDAKQPYPFALSYTYTTLTPASAEKCAVKIGTKLGKATAAEGETVPLTVTLENRQKQGQGMAVAVVGLPAGMRVPTDMKQLTDLREKGRIAFFETRGRELVLYWRELAPEQKIELTVELVADVPGVYRGPASRGYLYYDADHKHWVEPLSATVTPAAVER